MYIKVKVSPDFKREIFKKISEDHFEICVKEPAEQNRANRRVLELVSEYFGADRFFARLVSGHHSGSKIIDVTAKTEKL